MVESTSRALPPEVPHTSILAFLGNRGADQDAGSNHRWHDGGALERDQIAEQAALDVRAAREAVLVQRRSVFGVAGIAHFDWSFPFLPKMDSAASSIPGRETVS